MAGIGCSIGAPSNLYVKGFRATRCCSKNDSSNGTPPLLRFAVSGVTEILRYLTFRNNRMSSVNFKEKEEVPISRVEDVVSVLRADYDNAYFVTGLFTSSIYADDCLFEDPTIKFRGTKLYSRNLQLLVPFFEQPSISLTSIEQGANSERNYVLANWRLRTYLKLPWRPLITVDGSTVYELNDGLKIVKHSESWSVSALEAIGQIFTPSSKGSND